MHISDKNLGILTLLAIIGIGLTITALMVIKSNRATTHMVVLFDEMGSLQPEDPVTSRGFTIGMVGPVEWVDGKARVEVLLDQPTILHQGTTLRNENFSLMGQRRLEIRVDRSSPVVDKDHVFIGEFEPGIAEAMHLMLKVREQVIAIQEIAFLLRDGDSTHKSIPQATEQILSGAERMLKDIDRTVTRAKPQIRTTLGQVNTLSQEALRVTAQTDSTLRLLHAQGKMGIAEASNLILHVQKSLVMLIGFLDHLESQPFYTELMYKKEILTQINQLITTLQGVLSIFDKDGGLVILDEQGKPRGLMGLSNVNLIGKTAREKAKLRLKDSP